MLRKENSQGCKPVLKEHVMSGNNTQEFYDPAFEEYEKSFSRRSWLSKIRLLFLGSLTVIIIGGLAYAVVNELSKGNIQLVNGALEVERDRNIETLQRIQIDSGPVEGADAR